MAQYLEIQQFLSKQWEGNPVVDVRSPAEYEHAHIPGAVSIPLFNNEERAIVGTIYHHQGRQQAVQKGLELVGPKLKGFSVDALKLNSKEILVYCWRSGMRSSSMAWLFETIGLQCYLLAGGYKAYRNYVLDYLGKDFKYIVLGGCTGSGKTDILHKLQEKGEQVIDLEGLANHKGSAFGSIGQGQQPSSEYFEHLIFEKLSQMDSDKVIWVEDESRNVGKAVIPQGLWDKLSVAKYIRVDTPYQVRLDRIMRDYACFDPAQLLSSIMKIEKRIGLEQCKKAAQACQSGDLRTAAGICLDYYDKCYNLSIMDRTAKNGTFAVIQPDSLDVETIINLLLEISNDGTKDQTNTI